MQMQDAMAVVAAVDLVKVYGSGDTAVRALDGVTVGFSRAQFTAIMGPSGSGKSTLMHCLAGLDTATSVDRTHTRLATRRNQLTTAAGATDTSGATLHLNAPMRAFGSAENIEVDEFRRNQRPRPNQPGLRPHDHTIIEPTRRRVNDTALFFRQWLRNPTRVGGIVPSSAELARAITSPVPECGDPVVVELGPGTGPFTTEIQRTLAGRGRHLAIEANPHLAAQLRSRHLGAEIIHADAARLPQLLAERGLHHADVIVSSLPWAAFSAELQTRLMDAITTALRPDGAFTTFTYRYAVRLPAGRRLTAMLAERFEEVVPGRTVWRNLPPAYVSYARRPRS